ncbi:MAG: glucose-6-phosphate isomerase [Alphaproteobacteria bacterium]
MMQLPYSVSLDLALNGAGAPPRAAYEEALGEAKHALGNFQQVKPELLTALRCDDDLAVAAQAAEALKRHATDIFILGTGGSSLGAQALAGLIPFGHMATVRLFAFDNLDAKTFADALAVCDPKTTHFLVISKSGSTPETLMQALAAADLVKHHRERHIGERFLVITQPGASPLRRFAEAIGCPVLDHPAGIGGRFSVLTIVGLLPAILMELDVKAVREGARAALADPGHAIAGAALHFALSEAGRLRESVLWSYDDRLKTFGVWWRQLWAESLGKNGKGSTPVAALGPVDQHSQLQLFLEGPGGALFTVIAGETGGKGPVAPKEEAEMLGLTYLAGRTMGDLAAAEARATAETLANRGRPVRRIHVPQINEAAMGALFMHFMLETIIMGRLMRIDPFDQPAVEEGKVLARAYLEGKR